MANSFIFGILVVHLQLFLSLSLTWTAHSDHSGSLKGVLLVASILYCDIKRTRVNTKIHNILSKTVNTFLYITIFCQQSS